MPTDLKSSSKMAALKRLRDKLKDDSKLAGISVSKVSKSGAVEPDFDAGEALKKLLRSRRK